MKKIVFYLLLILSSLFIPAEVSDTSLNILYSITGVLFSVGMSLLIAFNTSEVRNDRIKKDLRTNMHKIRNCFTRNFLFGSILFIIYSFLDENKRNNYILIIEKLSITLHYSISVMIFFVFSICLYIYCFYRIQKFYETLEDNITEELKSKRKGL